MTAFARRQYEQYDLEKKATKFSLIAFSTSSFAEAIAGVVETVEDVEAMAANGLGMWLRMGLMVRERISICEAAKLVSSYSRPDEMTRCRD